MSDGHAFFYIAFKWGFNYLFLHVALNINRIWSDFPVKYSINTVSFVLRLKSTLTTLRILMSTF